MENVGYAALQIIPSMKGFESKLSSATSGPLSSAGSKGGRLFGDSAGKSLVSSFREHAKKAAVAGAIGLAGLGAAAVKFSSDAISAASDLAESQNKVQQVFGKSSKEIFNFAENAADAYGQTNQQARDAASTFGIFGHAAGLSDAKTAKFAIRMDKLASDLASFHNTSPEQAIEAIGAALRGESEPIRSYGVLLDEATLKAKALSLGLLEPVKNKAQIMSYQVAVTEGQKKYNDAVAEYGKKSLEALKAEANLGTARDRLTKATQGTIPPLTQQQKVLAAQAAIMDQTKVAQGDFARTSDGLANAQRRLSARFENVKAKIGTALLPMMQDFVGFLLDKGVPALEDFSDWFQKTGEPALKHFGGFVKGAAGATKDLLGLLNKLPDPAKYAGLVALLGGVGAAKLRGGGAGVLGGIGKAVGATKPVPVLVVNEGFGGVGGKGGGVIAAGGGKLATLGKATIGLGALYYGGKAFKDSGIPDKISNALGQNQELAKAIDGGREGMKAYVKELKESAEYWHTFEFKADSAFNGVEKAIINSTNHVKQYQHILGLTPKQVTTMFQLNGIDRAIAQADTLNAKLRAAADTTRGLDNGVTYQHGGTSGSSGGSRTLSGQVDDRVYAHYGSR